MDMVLVRSTYASEADAKAAARRLIERRVAACVHVQSVWSTYRWEGQAEESKEWLLEARTPEEHAGACWNVLLEGHPFENPLVEMLGPSRVPPAYATWAQASTR